MKFIEEDLDIVSRNEDKLNTKSSTYTNIFRNLFKYHAGTIKQSNIKYVPRQSSTHNTYSNVIIDSGASHHMWKDSTPFISFKDLPSSYITLANNYKILIQGIGTIQIKKMTVIYAYIMFT